MRRARRRVRLVDWRHRAGRLARTLVSYAFGRWTTTATGVPPRAAAREPRLRSLQFGLEEQHRATLLGAARLVAAIGEDRDLGPPAMVRARMSGDRRVVIKLLKELRPELRDIDDQDQRGLTSRAAIIASFDPHDCGSVVAGRRFAIETCDFRVRRSR